MKDITAQKLIEQIIQDARKRGISAAQLYRESGSDARTVGRWLKAEADPGYTKILNFYKTFKRLCKKTK